MQLANQVKIAVSFGPELSRRGGGYFPRKIVPLACLDGLSKTVPTLDLKFYRVSSKCWMRSCETLLSTKNDRFVFTFQKGKRVDEV